MAIESLIDLKFDEDFDVSFDDTGDLETVTGMEAAIGSVVLSTVDIVRDFVGGQNTPTKREQMRSKLEDEFVEKGYTDFEKLVITNVDEGTVEFSLVVSVDESYDFAVSP